MHTDALLLTQQLAVCVLPIRVPCARPTAALLARPCAAQRCGRAATHARCGCCWCHAEHGSQRPRPVQGAHQEILVAITSDAGLAQGLGRHAGGPWVGVLVNKSK
jgi:hypothetical protein